MTVKEYTLKYHQLSRYSTELVSSMRARIRKFASGLSYDSVLECKTTMLNNDIDIYRMVVYMQQVKYEKKKQVEVG